MKASIKPVLLKHKKLNNGKYPVFLRVTIDRKIKYFSLGSDFNCLEKEWSKKEGLFKPGFKDYLEMNTHIDDTVQKARKTAITLEQKGFDYTIEDFIVVDNEDSAIYLTPKKDSESELLVDNPLPIKFNVSEDNITSVVVEVIPSNLGNPLKYGYGTFSFTIIEQVRDPKDLTRTTAHKPAEENVPCCPLNRLCYN